MYTDTKRMTFLTAVLLVLAHASKWENPWKIAVGLAAGLNIFLIGIEIGRKLK